MKYLILGVSGWLAMSGTALAATADPSITAPLHQFIDSFNKGDGKAAAAAHNPAGVSIIDEVPPHIWQGPGAFQAWATDLGADAQRNGITEPSVALSEPTRTEVNGNRAYVVAPAVYSYKLKGVAMHEPAQMTFALEKGASGWMIDGWTWTGPYPTPVK
jgi:hypothetical protein